MNDALAHNHIDALLSHRFRITIADDFLVRQLPDAAIRFANLLRTLLDVRDIDVENLLSHELGIQNRTSNSGKEIRPSWPSSSPRISVSNSGHVRYSRTPERVLANNSFSTMRLNHIDHLLLRQLVDDLNDSSFRQFVRHIRVLNHFQFFHK